ncbi:hypothetical protein HYH03_003215 [Edaphochlamys debaryana]|uniref:Plastid ribosomal protein S6 n=1 Tax=Edaphochlamys debaryana TaxID=47281 RepID=A0A836C3P6_9CHLO|nr:hypothetical protein HYH03_003215 [Edaphochlamys debaryana]|eukprot:KAG2499030.1 hypothetical protein HYH03_003215 [Edaphochlamys debaryana]
MAATMQRVSSQSVTGRSSSASLVAARPIAQRLCFQSVVRQPAQRSSGARAAPKVLAAAAAVEASTEQKLPAGYQKYETMMILKSSLSDEERDRELAKFEAYLNKEECFDINALVRNRSKLAYPIKREWEGIYVLYTYAARRQTARAVQLLLSNPEAGAEDTVLRHITVKLPRS